MASVGAGDIQSPKSLERKADAKEEIVNATSGAREIVDHAAFNARAVGKILLHPFNKEAKSEAVAKAREDKAVSAQKQATIRAIAAQQAEQLRLVARGEVAPSPPNPSDVDADPAFAAPAPTSASPSAPVPATVLGQ